ncbi:Prolyl oligopeptidase family protein [Polystyrenella longa]|uniref:Prolyl oligopeptidase family protein n=1 Tax=Polystyrenella longa TaxID=2528007 RepID=A0A518CMK1_9PLAN|nr:prolyl oligopeptidase family serine peptidase [Polystyrenella longa]QDU80451.1 Prolyl oligopeptidase family protein [Polystyrenella longa]
MTSLSASRLTVALLVLCISLSQAVASAQGKAKTTLEQITQIPTADGKQQPIRVFVPELEKKEAVPLLVFLHSWSGNYKQSNMKWVMQAQERNWAVVLPNFQGPNFQPTACGSELAQQEILDALDYMMSTYHIDSSRIYLAGASGGGHMSMLMAAKHSSRFSAVSAWVGITDLNAWHEFHTRGEKPTGYALNIEASCGGKPGDSDEVDAQYVARSPLFHLGNTGDLPLDIAAGIHDGHTGSVPVSHSLNAFNVIASSRNEPTIPEQLIQEIVETEEVSADVSVFDSGSDSNENYPRKIHLRRTAGPARVTIFEGGHEGLAAAAIEWLAQQQRETKSDE